MKTYESMFLIDPTVGLKDGNKVPECISTILDKYNAKIIQSMKWAERQLSYSIKGYKRGNYYLIYFESSSENISKIKRECELSAVIFRAAILLIEASVKSKVLGSIDKMILPTDEVRVN
ncbi:MAG: 30S ribosomal protein S6 [Planctomycetota bacterium]